MITFGNSSPAFFELAACGFLLQRGHRPVKNKPHGVIPFDLDPQLPAAADYIGRKLEKQKTESFQSCGLKRLGQPQAADAIDKIVGDHPIRKTPPSYSPSAWRYR